MTEDNINKKETMLVISAHIGDFIWRSGGTIAKYIAEGHQVHLLVISDGIRGEANHYWRQPNANLLSGKCQRLEEGKKAAKILGLNSFDFWDLDDYPLELEKTHLEHLAHIYRKLRPDFVVTHDIYDAYNPDHDLVCRFARKAYACASGAGFQDGSPVSPRQIPFFGFEPHVTEICRFQPGVYVDITETFQIKCNAMKAMGSQPDMLAHYIRKAETRASEVRGRGARRDCYYAEAFSAFQAATATGRFIW